MTVQLFPVCGGIFVKSFPLFYGERLTWFFTEEKLRLLLCFFVRREMSLHREPEFAKRGF